MSGMVDMMSEVTDIPKTNETLSWQHPRRPHLAETADANWVVRSPDDLIAAEFGPPSNLSVDFDRLIAKRQELRESLPLKPMEVLAIVNNLEPDVAKDIYEQALKRIVGSLDTTAETNYGRDLIRTEVLGLAIDSFIRGRIEQTDMKWNPALKGANFDKAINVLYAGGNPPGPDKFLLTLGSRGVLPAPADAIKQEMIRTYPERHDASVLNELREQSVRNKNLRLLMQEAGFLVDTKDRNLVNIPTGRSLGDDLSVPSREQASREEHKSASARLDQLNNTAVHVPGQKGHLTPTRDKNLVDVLTTRSHGVNQLEAKSSLTFVSEFIKANPDTDPGKLTYTVCAVDELLALGIPTTTICEILKDPGVWCEMTDELDQSRWVYKGVEDIIDGRAAGLGLDALDVQGLVDADRLERQIERYQVMNIVQDGLKDQ